MFPLFVVAPAMATRQLDLDQIIPYVRLNQEFRGSDHLANIISIPKLSPLDLLGLVRAPLPGGLHDLGDVSARGRLVGLRNEA